MAGLDEMNTFIGKFVRLWQSGRDANLKIECKAGKAFAILQLDLGYPHPPPPHPHPRPVPSRVVRAGQVRRRQRRAAERQAAAEAEHEHAEAVLAEHEHAVAEEAEHERAVAEQAERVEAEQAEQGPIETEEVDNEIAAVEATNFTCDLCDRQCDSIRALRTHQRKKHETASSPIPQLDGGGETFGNGVNFTFVSEFAIEDVEYTLREIFPNIETNLLSRVKLIGPWSADHLCTLEIHLPDSQNFAWPEMSRVQAEVLTDIQKQ